MKLAIWIFLVAGVFGLLVTPPLVFGEHMMAVKQPEFYYGSFSCISVGRFCICSCPQIRFDIGQ